MPKQHITIQHVNRLFIEASMPVARRPRQRRSRRHIDYKSLRQAVLVTGGVRRMLALHCLKPRTIRGTQWRGPCGLHGSTNSLSTTLSINRARGAWQYCNCGETGREFDLHAKLSGLDVYDACCDLTNRLRLDAPYIEPPRQQKRRGTRRSKRYGND